MVAGKRKSERSNNKLVRDERNVADENRPTKRQRKEPTPNKKLKPTAGEGSTEAPEPPLKRPPQSSILTQEERAFPRGGGGALTPLEQKQIQVQATRDVLFEELGHKRPRAEGVRDEDDSDNRDESHGTGQILKKRKREKSHKHDFRDSESRIRVDGLKFRLLQPGVLVLGQVARILSQELVVDLPNNLSGFVSITNISAQLNAALETLADVDDLESLGERPEISDELDLTSLFHLGQYLRVCVVSTAEESSGPDATKDRKKIELSIDPRSVNAGLSASNIAVNCMIQASVASIEDHGFVMDLGLQGPGPKGFMALGDIAENSEASSIRVGSVVLCLVTGRNSSGNVLKLSAKPSKTGDSQRLPLLSESSSIENLLPGLAVEMLVSQVWNCTLAGTVMGMVTATADRFHSGAARHSAEDRANIKVGAKIKARIISTFPDATSPTVTISVLDHVLSLSTRQQIFSKPGETAEILPIWSYIEEAKITDVEPGLGLFVDTGVEGVPGFVHISRISDSRVESLLPDTGKYRNDSVHRARIIGFNSVDGIYLLSLQKSVLEQPFLRVEDIPLGQIFKVKVEKLVLDGKGRSGLIVHVAQGIGGFVREMHMADVRLQHPDRKFKQGTNVTARVLSIDLDRRQVILTLKKSLVNTELPIWSDYSLIDPDSQSIGTISSLNDHGAIVRFYGDVQAFLPASEMSETYIKEPIKHFQVGQAVTVRALSIEPEEKKMTVSCRVSVVVDETQKKAFKDVRIGDLVSGTVTEKSAEDITLELDGSGLKASLNMAHLSDGSNSKNTSILKTIRLGQQLQDLVVLELFEKRLSVVLTNKPSLKTAAKAGSLLATFNSAVQGAKVDGFVSGIIPNGVFIKFAAGLTGFLPKSNLTDEMRLLPDFGLTEGKSLSARIFSVDNEKKRFGLSLREPSAEVRPNGDGNVSAQIVNNSVDGVSTSIDDYRVGKITKARITSIKDTQLNVQLAENVQGRIDASEVFSSWDDIKDRKHPLKAFRVKQIIPVKVIGIHDARNHRFLPVSHRGGKKPVFELTAKIGQSSSVLNLDQVVVGSSYTAFVNNISDMCLWVNLSPSCRGRIERVEIADDVSLLNNLEENFPLGSAIRVRATHVDLNNGRLDLTARSSATDKPLSLDDLATGMIVTGRVTRVTDRSVLVQLSGTVAGHIGLTELADDFGQANPASHVKNDIVKVCIVEIDVPNKKVTLSSRPSKVLSSSLPVKDKSIISLAQLKVNDVVRGFIKNVADVGLFISLGHNVTAFVRVSEMFDTFMKDWKSNYEVDRLVTGKVISVDSASNQVQLSLKPSVLDKNYVPPITFNDLHVGQIVTGKIRKVEDFGAFIVVDNSHNVSGLCHRSEIAEKRIQDVRTLYSEGDVIKARVLKLEPETRRVSFGLKASYFEDASDIDEFSDNENGDEEVDLTTDERLVEAHDDSDEESLENGGVQVGTAEPLEYLPNDEVDQDDVPLSPITSKESTGLNPGGFDWNGDLEQYDSTSARDSESEGEQPLPKKKRRKAAIAVDQTGDLDKYGPRSADDFERLLLGQPNSSELWLQYMAFQLEHGDIDGARQLAERALKRINITEQEEKLNIWTAYLNLETQYGDDETVDAIFKRARTHADAQEIHERLASIYISSAQPDKASALFQTMTKTKAFTPDPKLWEHYAAFLFDTAAQPDDARRLLDRATQAVAPFAHRDLVTRFAQLEFRCRHGDPERGRTMFEGLLDAYPKRWDLWDVFVDMEKQQRATQNVRRLFERMAALPMKKRRARGVFERWRAFEEGEGDRKRVEQVKMKEAAYQAKHQLQQQSPDAEE